MIPLPVILVEFMIAFGLALFGANALALFRLRRDGDRAAANPSAGTTAAPGAAPAPAPSRGRILVGLVLGLLVTLWGIATWVTSGFSF